MIFHFIHHKMPIYKDCTLGEVLCVGICVLLVLGFTFGILTKLLFGYLWIGLLVSLVFLLHVTRLCLSKLQKIKYGKPFGFYQHLFIKKSQKALILNSLYKSPFIERQGKWTVRRK